VLDVRLDRYIVEPAANETLDTEHGAGGILRGPVLGRTADKTLVFGEGDIGGGGAVALVVGDNFYSVVLPDCDATADRWVIAVGRVESRE
jgi:hypothetical protein